MAAQPLIGSGTNEEKIFSAFCCAYTSIDLSDINICTQMEQEALCCTEGCCLSADATPYPIGMVSPDAFTFIGKDGHCCAIGLPCCFIGLKSPSTLCNSAGHCLCVKSRAQCPCGDAVPACVCAACFLSCTPQCACLRTPDVATSFKR
eukprot:m.20513 g.20513  ORF g.20513 m.20513 type:complete len:148 (-) comp10232_c0_seq1:110-553(-)